MYEKSDVKTIEYFCAIDIESKCNNENNYSWVIIHKEGFGNKFAL